MRELFLPTVTAAALIVSCLAAAPARAETPLPTSGSSTSVAAPVYVEEVGQSGSSFDRQSYGGEGDPRALAYWTEERMATAVPAETGVLSPVQEEEFRQYSAQGSAESGSETTSAPALSEEDTMSVQAADPVTNFNKRNGKIFYRDARDGLNYVCSGSAVASSSQRLVATAGHCVHGGPGGSFHQNWVFVPEYSNGARPYGTFSARTLRTMNDWMSYGGSGRGYNSDVAFVTTNVNAAGKTLVNAVGGYSVTFGGSEYVFDVSIFGYPANREAGEVMYACWGTTGSRDYDSYKFHTISGCDFGGGASGGPWLKGYSNSTGQGSVKSVTSWGPKGSTAHANGPFFRTDVQTMFRTANTD